MPSVINPCRNVSARSGCAPGTSAWDRMAVRPGKVSVEGGASELRLMVPGEAGLWPHLGLAFSPETPGPFHRSVDEVGAAALRHTACMPDLEVAPHIVISLCQAPCLLSSRLV